MKRKINLVGTGTLTVSLPASWVKRNKLEKGDEVEVMDDQNRLIIATEKVPEKGEITVDMRGVKEEYFSRRIFLIPYTRGYNRIKILFDKPWMFQRIEENRDRVAGFEIVEQGEGYCVLENILTPNEEEFDKVYQRLYGLIVNMNKLYEEGIKRGDDNAYRNIIHAEKITNTLDQFCRRLLNMGKFQEKENITNVYMLVRGLEGVSDTYRDMAKKSIGYKYKNKEVFLTTLGYLEQMLQIVRDIKKESYSEDILNFKKTLVQVEKYMDANVRKLNTTEADIFGHFRVAMRYVHEMSEEGVYI